jgi:hypothetical protein
MSVLDDYLVDPKLLLLDKTRIQAQVLVPVLRALRSELGKRRPMRSSQHEAWCQEDTEVVDIFAPPREDFLKGGTPAYMREN